MTAIKPDRVDALDNLLTEFGVLTYLQGLMQYDKNGYALGEPEMEIYGRSSWYYLWNRQLEAVVKFKKLLNSEDFVKGIDENTE